MLMTPTITLRHTYGLQSLRCIRASIPHMARPTLPICHGTQKDQTESWKISKERDDSILSVSAVLQTPIILHHQAIINDCGVWFLEQTVNVNAFHMRQAPRLS